MEGVRSYQESLIEGTDLPESASSESADALEVSGQVSGQSGSGMLYEEVRLYSSGIALVVGIPTCCLILAMLRGVYFRRTTAGLFLVIITLCDLGLLFSRALRWFVVTVIGLDLAAFGLAGCMVFQHMSHFFHHVSGWCLVIVAVERALVIRSSATTPKALEPRRLQLMFVLVTLLCLLLNLHWYWNVLQMKDKVGTTPESEGQPWCPLGPHPSLPSGWIWVDLTFGDLLPVLFLLVVTSVLSATLGFALAKKRSIIHSASANNFSNFESQVTHIALGLSCLFLVTRLPMVIVRLGMATDLWPMSQRVEALVWSSCYVIQLVYISFKLPLYLMVGNKMYLSLAAALGCCGPPDNGRKTAMPHINGLDDSDQQASKGLSQSTQGSPRDKVEQLKGLLIQLEQGPGPLPDQLVPPGPRTRSVPEQQGAAPDSTKKDEQPVGNSSVQPADPDLASPEKPRKKKLSSSRQRQLLRRSVDRSSIDSEQDSDLGSSVCSSQDSPPKDNTQLAVSKRPLETVLSTRLTPDAQGTDQDDNE